MAIKKPTILPLLTPSSFIILFSFLILFPLLLFSVSAMAIKKPTILPLLLFSTILLGALLLKPVHGAEDTVTQNLLQANGFGEEGPSWGWRMMKNARRLMIGSTAPICTYNECRGCRFKCRAEQIPVDANDPINSAYHYRCVCHR